MDTKKEKIKITKNMESVWYKGIDRVREKRKGLIKRVVGFLYKEGEAKKRRLVPHTHSRDAIFIS